MAEIKFKCSSCGQPLAAEEEYADMYCQCPICYKIMTIPELTNDINHQAVFHNIPDALKQITQKKKVSSVSSSKKEMEKIYLRYPELETFFISLYDTPTNKQVIYALKLGIQLKGQNFKEISNHISAYKSNSSKRRKIYIPIELEDSVYNRLINNAHDQFVTINDINCCFENEHLIFPNRITYRQLNKILVRFYDKIKIANCPHCGVMIYNGDGHFLDDNICSTCKFSLKNLGIAVTFSQKGNPVFSKQFSHR